MSANSADNLAVLAQWANSGPDEYAEAVRSAQQGYVEMFNRKKAVAAPVPAPAPAPSGFQTWASFVKDKVQEGWQLVPLRAEPRQADDPPPRPERPVVKREPLAAAVPAKHNARIAYRARGEMRKKSIAPVFKKATTIVGASHTAPGVRQRMTKEEAAERVKELGSPGQKMTRRSTVKKDPMFIALNARAVRLGWF